MGADGIREDVTGGGLSGGRLGAVRLGAGRLGAVRLGAGRLGAVRLGAVRLGAGWLGGGGIGAGGAGARRARPGLGLAALATAAFVYVTAETLPVGLLPQLSAGLHVRPGSVGLLVTIYAAVAGLMAVPVTVLTGRIPRRRVVVGAVALLALSQLVMALAPDYPVVLAARVAAAFAHGVFWSVLAPVAGRLAAPGRAGRATAIVFTGNSLALVLGTPLATALGQVLGWRAAMAVVGAAAAVSVAALRATLPPLPAETPGGGLRARFAAIPAALRSGSLAAVCVVTLLVVTAHFIPYTYISVLVRRAAGLTGLALSAVLLAYGVAGIAGIGLTGLVTDRRPRLASAACAVTLTAALAVMTTAAHGSAVVTVAAVMAWGAAFTALPVVLQAAVLRVAPRSADTASALYVVTFQIGIGGGALAGSVLVNAGLTGQLSLIGTVLAAAGAATLLAARRAFPARPAGPTRHGRPRPAPPAGATPAGTGPAGTGPAGTGPARDAGKLADRHA